MDLTTMTPAAIDTELVKVMETEDRKVRIATGNLSGAKRNVETALQVRERGGVVFHDTYWFSMKPEAELKEAESKLIEAKVNRAAAIAPFDAEFKRRGGWTRYFIVANVNGHVHQGFDCSTCYPSTEYNWLPSLSGLTAAEMVAVMGETACTVCYPDAPTFKGFGDGTSFVAKLSAAEKDAKAAEKAKKAAEKAEKAITDVDGSPLYEDHIRKIYAIKTLVTAQRRMVQEMESAGHCDPNKNDHLRNLRASRLAQALYLARAISAKTGESYENVVSDAVTKANKKLKKAGFPCRPIENEEVGL